MRKLNRATIIPLSTEARTFARRPVQAVRDILTCLVLYRHDENPTQLFVSDNGDAISAVWIKRQPLLVDPKDRGPFLVLTLPRQMAMDKHLRVSLFDWDRYTPQERVMLKDAVETAQRTRQRLSGRPDRCATHHGRNAFA